MTRSLGAPLQSPWSLAGQVIVVTGMLHVFPYALPYKAKNERF